MKKSKVRRMILWILLPLLIAVPVSIVWAEEGETTTQTENQYEKEVSEDNTEAGELQWYKNNSAILSNHSVVEDAVRWLGFGIIKLACRLSNICETLYDKTFGLIDLTQYESVNDILETLKPVLIALSCLCCVGLGITLIVKQQKMPLVRNILLGILAVSCSGYIFSTANNLVSNFKAGILGSTDANQSYTLVNNNIIDFIAIDKQGGINALNYTAGDGILYGVGAKGQNDLNQIDINETLDWHTASNGKNLYNWSADFNNKMKYHIRTTSDGSVAEKNYDGLTNANIGNQFYYRYSFDFWSCALQLISLLLLFCALSYKNVRIAYELVVSRIMAYMYAADVTSGERLKNILLFIRDTYITLCVSVLCVKLYAIFTGAITAMGITGLGKGVVSLFVAYAVIDGPNLVERLLGMDAGLKSSFARTAAMFGLAGSALRTGGKAAKGVKNTAAAAATGMSAMERKQMNGGATAGEVLGKKLNQKIRGDGTVGKGFSNAAGAAAEATAASDNEEGQQKNGQGTQDSNQNAAGSTPGFMDGKKCRPSADDNPEQGSSSADGAVPTGRQSAASATPDFMGNGKGAPFTSDKPVQGSSSADEAIPTGQQNSTSSKPNFMNDGKGVGRAQQPSGAAAKMPRVSNPAFSEAIKRLSPDANATSAERKDFNKQVNAIVRGKNHAAIQPPSGGEEFQMKNYKKAKELEKAYHAYPGKNSRVMEKKGGVKNGQ